MPIKPERPGPSPSPCRRRWPTRVQRVVKEEDRTVSEFLREAIRLYIEEREWRRTIRHERLRDCAAQQEEARRRTHS